MLFPRHSTLDYVEVDDPGLTGLSAVTVCAWVKLVKNANGTIISYAVLMFLHANEIGIWCYTNEVVFCLKSSWEHSGKIVYEFAQVADVMLCYVMLCYVMLCYVMLCYVMLCYVMLCYVMLCYVMLCYVMLCYVMLCYVMLCYVMLCFVMLCYSLHQVVRLLLT